MEKFDIIAEPSSNGMGLYKLKRARRKDKSRMGDIVPLERIRTDIEVVPAFGKIDEAWDSDLTSFNSMKRFTSFYLNHFCDDEVFYMFFDLFRVPTI